MNVIPRVRARAHAYTRTRGNRGHEGHSFRNCIPEKHLRQNATRDTGHDHRHRPNSIQKQTCRENRIDASCDFVGDAITNRGGLGVARAREHVVALKRPTTHPVPAVRLPGDLVIDLRAQHVPLLRLRPTTWRMALSNRRMAVHRATAADCARPTTHNPGGRLGLGIAPADELGRRAAIDPSGAAAIRSGLRLDFLATSHSTHTPNTATKLLP